MSGKLLIVDLEATCWEGNVPGKNRSQTIEDMEIIEFGCVVADYSGRVFDSRSFFVRPVLHPQLSDFCTSLTGISKRQVDGSPTFIEATREIDIWLEKFNINFWGSWGNYDRNQLEVERQRHQVVPKFFTLEHVNLKKAWRKGKPNSRRSALRSALEYHGLEFEGTPHRGIDDARNIARLVSRIEWS